MENLKLNEMGLVELNENEAQKVDGGIIPLIILAAYCTGVFVGVIIAQYQKQ